MKRKSFRKFCLCSMLHHSYCRCRCRYVQLQSFVYVKCLTIQKIIQKVCTKDLSFPINLQKIYSRVISLKFPVINWAVPTWNPMKSESFHLPEEKKKERNWKKKFKSPAEITTSFVHTQEKTTTTVRFRECASSCRGSKAHRLLSCSGGKKPNPVAPSSPSDQDPTAVIPPVRPL